MPGARKKRRRRVDEVFEIYDDEDPIRVLMNRAMEHPQVHGTILQVRGVLDSFGAIIDGVARRVPPPPPTNGTGHARARRPATPTPVATRDLLADARATLHFGPAEKISKDAVKRRRKELAAMCHPDRGGSDEAMRKINAAADALLGGL